MSSSTLSISVKKLWKHGKRTIIQFEHCSELKNVCRSFYPCGMAILEQSMEPNIGLNLEKKQKTVVSKTISRRNYSTEVWSQIYPKDAEIFRYRTEKIGMVRTNCFCTIKKRCPALLRWLTFCKCRPSKGFKPHPKDGQIYQIMGEFRLNLFYFNSKYWQMFILKEGSYKPALLSQHCLYQLSGILFGLHNAPASYQRTADIILEPARFKLLMFYKA